MNTKFLIIPIILLIISFGIGTGYALQLSVPDTDPSVRWVNAIGCSDLQTHECVDELVRDDNDYIQSVGIGKTNVDKQFYTLSDVTDPLSSINHVLTYTVREANVGTNPVKLNVILYQGNSIIASWANTNLSTTFTGVSQSLTALQADSITDYTNLKLELDASCDGTCGNSPSAREKIQVSWIQFTVD